MLDETHGPGEQVGERPEGFDPAAPRAWSGVRLRHVERAVKAWTGQLIDLGGRNNLLYYRDLRRGTLELTGANDKAFVDLLSGRQVPLARLFDGEALEDALPRARTIRNKSREHFEERGLETLFLACGRRRSAQGGVWLRDAKSRADAGSELTCTRRSGRPHRGRW